MTSFGVFTDLWKVFGIQPFKLTEGSSDVDGKNISIYRLEGHDPRFASLSRELMQTSKVIFFFVLEYDQLLFQEQTCLSV